MHSLQELIERLRDPRGYSHLFLDEDDLMSIVKYQGVEDFAEVYVDFLDAVKGNTTVTSLEFSSFRRTEKPSLFPIINPLCRHLPRVEKTIFPVESNSPVERFLCKEAKSFTTVRISQEDGVVLPLELNPDLQVFQHTDHYSSPSNEGIERRFTEPELNWLFDLVQVSSLVKLELDGFRFETEQDCSRLARALTGSPVQDLFLSLYTSDSGNYRSVISAIAEMPNLKALKAYFALDESDDEAWIRSFSIPLGDLVRRSPRMKSLTIRQYWRGWDKTQYQDLAVSLQAPMCGLETLHIDIHDATMNDAATIMSTFSAPSSSVKEFTLLIAPPFEKEDVEAWLLKLPRTTALQSLTIDARALHSTKVRDLQEKFVAIVSRWFHLEHFGGTFASVLLDRHDREQLCTLMRLNKAGRHYLTSPTPSKADGVEVLIKVREYLNEYLTEYLNEIYTHLLENPCLCDRSVAAPCSPTASPIRKKAREN